MTHLADHYTGIMVPEFMKKNPQCTNVHAVPQLKYIVVDTCVGQATQDSRKLTEAFDMIRSVTGVQPVKCRAKKSEANFKLRQGMYIACKATLRKRSMYEFMDRFITLALPRTRDFKGVSSRGFNNLGHYALGVRDSSVFWESQLSLGLSIVFGISSKSKEESQWLLEGLGLPFVS